MRVTIKYLKKTTTWLALIDGRPFLSNQFVAIKNELISGNVSNKAQGFLAFSQTLRQFGLTKPLSKGS